MIYGYALAVIAGFLLTAVRNWTGIQTIHGRPLQLLFLLWFLARIISLTSGQYARIAGILLDNFFLVSLSVVLTVPIVRAKLWKNMGVISKVYFLLAGNIIYSLGLLGSFPDGERIGIYIGLYMILSLILVLSRRVMPMFIEGGVGYAVSLKNHLWVDISGFLLFLTFAISDIFLDHPALTAWLAAALFMLHCIRIWGWHTHGIWSKPLLWALYLAYAWIILPVKAWIDVFYPVSWCTHKGYFSPDIWGALLALDRIFASTMDCGICIIPVFLYIHPDAPAH